MHIRFVANQIYFEPIRFQADTVNEFNLNLLEILAQYLILSPLEKS